MGTQQVLGSGVGHFSEYVCVSVKYRITREIPAEGSLVAGTPVGSHHCPQTFDVAMTTPFAVM